MRSVKIKGMWRVKTRCADVLIGQSLVVSVLADLCYRCSMMLCIVSVMFIAATIATACDPLMSVLLCLPSMCALLKPLHNKSMHWCSCHIIAQNCVSALIEWSLSRLSLFFVGQSVNCSFFVCFVFGIMTKTIWLWRSESSDQKPRLTCSWLSSQNLSPLMTPWPGRNESPQRRLGELELVHLELCRLFGHRKLIPSLIPRCQHFLSHHFALDGAQCALPCEASTVLDFT